MESQYPKRPGHHRSEYTGLYPVHGLHQSFLQRILLQNIRQQLHHFASLPGNPDTQTGIKSLAALNQPAGFCQLPASQDAFYLVKIFHIHRLGHKAVHLASAAASASSLKELAVIAMMGMKQHPASVFCGWRGRLQAVHLRHLEIHKNGMIRSGILS